MGICFVLFFVLILEQFQGFQVTLGVLLNWIVFSIILNEVEIIQTYALDVDLWQVWGVEHFLKRDDPRKVEAVVNQLRPSFPLWRPSNTLVI